jgi:hypothetical protein
VLWFAVGCTSSTTTYGQSDAGASGSIGSGGTKGASRVFGGSGGGITGKSSSQSGAFTQTLAAGGRHSSPEEVGGRSALGGVGPTSSNEEPLGGRSPTAGTSATGGTQANSGASTADGASTGGTTAGPSNFCASVPCKNGAECVNGASSYTCTCAKGYTGSECQTNIDDCSLSPCLNGGTYVDGVASYTCDCKRGFSGPTCNVNVNDCADKPCMNGGTCADGADTYTCACPDGYTGTNCQTNINDCSPNPCQHGGACADGVNSYTCNCNGTGYQGTTCQTNIDECSPNPCQHGGACTDGLNSYTCNCGGTGYQGTTCETNINDCSPNPCLNGGACSDGVNSYTCRCVSPWSGDRCANATLLVDADGFGFYSDLIWVGWGPNMGTTGVNPALPVNYRSYYAFTIPNFSGTVQSVALLIEPTLCEGSPTGETIGVYDVSTSIASLVAGTAETTAAWTDLGTGTQYATLGVTPMMLNTTRDVPLSSTAASAVGSAKGGGFAVGLSFQVVTGTEQRLIKFDGVHRLRIAVTGS